MIKNYDHKHRNFIWVLLDLIFTFLFDLFVHCFLLHKYFSTSLWLITAIITAVAYTELDFFMNVSALHPSSAQNSKVMSAELYRM